ncbi:ABC transporter permease [Streptomyces sp. NPDC002644]
MTTTLTPPAPPRRDATAPAKAPGGLARTVLRLHRWALWLWIAYVALGTGLLLWAWGPAVNELRAVNASCDLDARVEPACATDVYAALAAYQDFMVYGFAFAFLAPLLVGAWAAASLTAREMETGTAELAWTQSVSPTRWLTAKLALPAVAATAGVALLLALYRLAHQEGTGLYRDIHDGTPGWWNEDLFTATGIVTVPRVLCAVAVGVLLGLLLRRTLASLVTGLLVMATGIAALRFTRHLLWPTDLVRGADTALPGPYPRVPDHAHAWEVSSGVVTESGELVPHGTGDTWFFDCVEASHRPGREPDFDADGFSACLADNGYTDVWASYHPESHFWPLQLVESGLWLAVAVAAVVLSYRLLRRRTAA